MARGVVETGRSLKELTDLIARYNGEHHNAGGRTVFVEGQKWSSGDSETQIVPLIVGDASEAMDACERALARGIFAQAIRPPTVPDGTSRLRLAVMASHTRSELRRAASVLAEAHRCCAARVLMESRRTR